MKVLLGILIIGLIIKILIDAYYAHTFFYKSTEYYRQTKKPLRKLFHPPIDEDGNKKDGCYNEYMIYMLLRKLPSYKKFVFNSGIYYTKNKYLETDVIMIHSTGIYAFESKDYSGYVMGKKDDNEWQKHSYSGSSGHSRYNPIKQNQEHVENIKKFLDKNDIHDTPIFSYVVFGDDCEVVNVDGLEKTDNVLLLEQLTQRIQNDFKNKPSTLDKRKINEIYKILRPTADLTEEEKAEHIRQIKEKYGE